MKLTAFLPISCGAFLATLGAQTLTDDFNDNSRDPDSWGEPWVEPGRNGELLEVNQRLEFSAVGSSEGAVSQQLLLRPGYNQFWQAQMVVAVDEASITAADQIGLISIGLTKDTDGEAYIDVGYLVGDIDEIPTGKEAVLSYGSDEANQEGLVTVNDTNLPEVIGVRIVYDPDTRTVRTYYDLDADQDDGEWTLLETYTIDGSTIPGARTLDWNMSETGSFIIELNGESEGGAVIASGSAWADDAEISLGRTIGQATTSDDFDDDSRDTGTWNAPVGDGELVETNQRLEFRGSDEEENDVSQSVQTMPLYDSPWQVQLRASVDKTIFSTAGEDGSIALEISNTSGGNNEYLGIGFAAGVLEGFADHQAIFANGADDVIPEELEMLDVRALPDAIGIRITYDPNHRLLRAYYNLDEVLRDSAWQPFEAFTIDGSSYPDAESLSWGMSTGDRFFIEINGHSSNRPILAGQAWADDFRLNVGTTAQSEDDNQLLDDFNDDHLEPLAGRLWEMPQADLGSPVFVDTNHRRELIVASASGEHEIRQAVDQRFNPRYDQAFEMKVEAHCQPSGLAAADDFAVAELEIASDNGGEILFSLGVLHNGISVDSILAVSNSKVLPFDDEPDLLDMVTLPEVVGIRIVWDPDTKILSCHVDTDGDRTVETWVPYADYTLDGSNQGTDFMSDWGMNASDRFALSLNGGCENVAVSSGEAYFDNFQLFTEPLPTGYALWAEGIPDEGRRGENDDASGNGIPNILQYMYGLEPLSTRTDVLPRIELVAGSPVLIHGTRNNADPAPDYAFDYQESTTLEASGWSSFATWESAEQVEIDGSFFLRVTFPMDSPSKFYRLGLLSIE